MKDEVPGKPEHSMQRLRERLRGERQLAGLTANGGGDRGSWEYGTHKSYLRGIRELEVLPFCSRDKVRESIRCAMITFSAMLAWVGATYSPS